MKKLIQVSFFFLFITLYGQEIKFVKAKNGLIIREYPNKKSMRIGKFDYGVGVHQIKETGIEINIVDDGKKIIGQWVEVKETLGNLTGFVFSGFLTSNVINKGAETDNYYLTKIDPKAEQDFWGNMTTNPTDTVTSSIYLRNKKNKDLFKFTISNFESYDGTFLRAKNVSSLQNIKEVIIVESNYSACCSTHISTYLLITANNQIIELPEITNSHCDGPEPYFDYIFNKSNKIQYAKITPNEEKEEVEVLKTYKWDSINFIEE